MKFRPRVFSVLILTGSCLFTFGREPAAAQDGLGWGAGPSVQLFRFSEADVAGVRSASLLTVPIAVRAELGHGTWLSFSSAWARATMERPDGASVELSGLTDSRAEITWAAPGEWLTLSAVGVLPTGTTGFSADEMELAGLTAVDLLPFHVSNWGAGGGVGGGFSAVRSAGLWGFGVSGSYLVSGEFEPVREPSFEYRPGDQWTSRVVVDRQVGATSRMSVSVAMNRSRDDQIDQENVFRPGNRFQILNSWAFPAGATGSGLVYGGYLHRSGSTFDPPAGSSSVLSNQGLLLLGAGLRQPSSYGILIPTAELRVLRREDGEGQGWILGVGASVEHRSGSVTWVPSAVVRAGGIRASEGPGSSVTGLELGLRARFGGATR